MAQTWLSNTKCYTQIFTKESSTNFSLQTAFKELYQKSLYTDHTIILRDAQGEIPLNIHRTILILTCPYFEKTWSFKDGPVENPLVINVLDAKIAQKVIESLYGIEYVSTNSVDILLYASMRDFFSLSYDYRNLAHIPIPEEYYDLFLKVIYQFKSCDQIARILNRVFFPIEIVTPHAIDLLRKSGLEITPETEKRMIEQDLRYEIIMRFGRKNNNILMYDSFQEKYLKIGENTDEYTTYNFTYSSDKSIILLGKYIPDNINKRIEKWNTKIGILEEIFMFKCKEVNLLCISPDNSTIVADIDYAEIIIWKNNNKRILHLTTGTGRYYIVDFFYTPNGKYFIVTSNDTISIYDGNTFEFIKMIDARYLRGQICSPNSLCLAQIQRNWNSLNILYVDTLEPFLTINLEDDDNNMVYSPDSQKILTVSCNTKINIWDTLNGKNLYKINFIENITSVKWPNDKHIILGTNNSIYFLDAISLEILRKDEMSENIFLVGCKSIQ